MNRPPLSYSLGSTDESYGTMVWLNRVQNLQSHFEIILDYLPEDREWLRRQTISAIKQAQQYIDDYAPVISEDDDPFGGDALAGGF